MDTREERRDSEALRSTSARRVYRRPVLTEYGPVAKLTQGTNTVGNDGPGNTMKNVSCL